MSRFAPLLLVLTACGGGAAPAPDDVGPTTDAVAIEAAVEEPAPGDPLLAEARTKLGSGTVPDELAARILESKDPAHARARRILAVMQRQESGEPAPEGDGGTEVEAPHPQVIAPNEGQPEAADSGGEEAEAPTPADDQDQDQAPKLTVVTRLSLEQKGRQATLTMHAASSLRVGVAEQSGTVRLVVESAGALPALLKSRPSVDGLRVSDVRRGDGTIQVAVELGEGWSMGRPAGFSGGARVKFTRR